MAPHVIKRDNNEKKRKLSLVEAVSGVALGSEENKAKDDMKRSTYVLAKISSVIFYEKYCNVFHYTNLCHQIHVSVHVQ